MSDETTKERIERRLREEGKHGLHLPSTESRIALVMAEEIERLRAELLRATGVPVSKLRAAITRWETHDLDVTLADLVEGLIAEVERNDDAKA